MFKLVLFFLILGQVAHAEVVNLKDLLQDEDLSSLEIKVKESPKTSEQHNIAKINSFFKRIQDQYPELGTFVFLDESILMSRINHNINLINPKITQFRPFTLFKMEKMEAIFTEINFYLKETYEKEKSKNSLRIEVE